MTTKPTKLQQEVMRLLKEYHWKVWVPDSELTRARHGIERDGVPTQAQVHAVRRVCFQLQARGLVEPSQDGLGSWSFKLTRACREVLS